MAGRTNSWYSGPRSTGPDRVIFAALPPNVPWTACLARILFVLLALVSEVSMKSKRRIMVLMAGLAVVFATSCNTDKNTEVYYLIAANVQLSYWQTAANGFNK